MSKGLFAGMTDYSHQSFSDILQDLGKSRNLATFYKEIIQRDIKELENSQYWSNSVPADFKIIVAHALHHYATVVLELGDIQNDLMTEVKEHHIKRLRKISSVASEINIDIGKNWHREYESKDYGNESFSLVESIYENTRDTAVSLLDIENLAVRLNDFVGKKSKVASKKKSKLGLGLKITIASFVLAIVVLLFGDNIIERYSNSKKGSKGVDSLSQADTLKGATVDSLKLSRSESVVSKRRLADSSYMTKSKMVKDLQQTPIKEEVTEIKLPDPLGDFSTNSDESINAIKSFRRSYNIDLELGKVSKQVVISKLAWWAIFRLDKEKHSGYFAIAHDKKLYFTPSNTILKNQSYSFYPILNYLISYVPDDDDAVKCGPPYPIYKIGPLRIYPCKGIDYSIGSYFNAADDFDMNE